MCESVVDRVKIVLYTNIVCYVCMAARSEMHKKTGDKRGLHNYVNIYLYTGCQDDIYKISFYL